MSARSLLHHFVAGASMPPLGGRILMRPVPAPRRRRRAGTPARGTAR